MKRVVAILILVLAFTPLKSFAKTERQYEEALIFHISEKPRVAYYTSNQQYYFPVESKYVKLGILTKMKAYSAQYIASEDHLPEKALFILRKVLYTERISQAEVARRLKADKTTLNRWLKGHNKISPPWARIIVDVFKEYGD